jgi:uncharacterized protein YukE
MTGAWSGAGAADQVRSITDAHDAVASGAWMDSALGGAGTTLDALGTIADPLASVASWGVPWLVEQVQPLSEALAWLAGDPEQVEAQAGAWARVAGTARQTAATVRHQAETDLAGWSGAAADAYRTHLAGYVETVRTVAVAADGLSSALTGAGQVIAATRERVRAALAEFVEVLALRLDRWIAEEACTFGVATPWIVAQVAVLVGRWADRIAALVQALIASLDALSPLVRTLSDGLDGLLDTLHRQQRPPPAPAVLPHAPVPPPGTEGS